MQPELSTISIHAGCGPSGVSSVAEEDGPSSSRQAEGSNASCSRQAVSQRIQLAQRYCPIECSSTIPARTQHDHSLVIFLNSFLNSRSACKRLSASAATPASRLFPSQINLRFTGPNGLEAETMLMYLDKREVAKGKVFWSKEMLCSRQLDLIMPREESFCYNIYKAATTRVPATSQTANLFLHCLPTIDA
eukprot:scaffold114361_cov19-Tisochrysis_lutea.AAC.1